jgi:hypothetical protein
MAKNDPSFAMVSFGGARSSWRDAFWVGLMPGCQLACPNFIQTKRFHFHSRAASQESAQARK